MFIKNNVSLYFLLKRFNQVIFLACIFITASISPKNFAADNIETKLDSTILNVLKSGQHVILLRHALAPGFGDPDYFDVGDCNTQRNLSEQGRQQAQRIGKLLKAKGIQQAAVFSSQWCRSLETGRLLGLGEVTELPIINSFFQRSERKSKQTQQLREWLKNNNSLDKNKPTLPIILVTHQVNITGLTGVSPSSGELVIIDVDKSGNVNVIGQLETDN